MAKIIINDDLQVNGKLSFERGLVEEAYIDTDGSQKTKQSFRIEGVLSTHLYFDDIEKLETNRYELEGVEVYKEAFASDDYNILYYFTARRLNILGSNQKGVTYILYGEEMKMIENEMYKDEHPILGDIGAEFKEMYLKNDEEESDDKKEE